MVLLKGIEPKSIEIPDGLHQGKITKVEERQVKGRSYSYLDVYITHDHIVKDDKEKLVQKVGYAIGEGDGIIPSSELGKLVKRFTNEEVVKDKQYDMEQILILVKVQFQTIKIEGEKYSNIIKSSLKPVNNPPEGDGHIEAKVTAN